MAEEYIKDSVWEEPGPSSRLDSSPSHEVIVAPEDTLPDQTGNTFTSTSVKLTGGTGVGVSIGYGGITGSHEIEALSRRIKPVLWLVIVQRK